MEKMSIDKEFRKRFLTDTDSSGRFIVKSIKTGRTYYVEPIDDGNRSEWGDLNPATKKNRRRLWLKIQRLCKTLRITYLNRKWIR